MPGRPGAASGVPVLLADPPQPPVSALGSFGQPGLTLSTPELSSRLHPLIPLSPSAPGRQAAPLSLPRETKKKESQKTHPCPCPPARPPAPPGEPAFTPRAGAWAPPLGSSGQSISVCRRFASSILTHLWVGPSSTPREVPWESCGWPGGGCGSAGVRMEEPGPGGDLQHCEGKWDFSLGSHRPIRTLFSRSCRIYLYAVLNAQVRSFFCFLFFWKGLCSLRVRAKQLRRTRLVRRRGGGKGRGFCLATKSP